MGVRVGLEREVDEDASQAVHEKSNKVISEAEAVSSAGSSNVCEHHNDEIQVAGARNRNTIGSEKAMSAEKEG